MPPLAGRDSPIEPAFLHYFACFSLRRLRTVRLGQDGHLWAGFGQAPLFWSVGQMYWTGWSCIHCG